jgi:hypothetical protein
MDVAQPAKWFDWAKAGNNDRGFLHRRPKVKAKGETLFLAAEEWLKRLSIIWIGAKTRGQSNLLTAVFCLS